MKKYVYIVTRQSFVFDVTEPVLGVYTKMVSGKAHFNALVEQYRESHKINLFIGDNDELECAVYDNNGWIVERFTFRKHLI